jgi:hypothetical protein
MQILLASNNEKKAAELAEILAPIGAKILKLSNVASYEEPIENGKTFADNALIKARAGAAHTDLITIADDSGLVVDELNGCPGVLSARWSGKHGDDEANNNLLLGQMEHVPDERRQAAFVCVCAVVFPNGEEAVVEGRWDGQLLRKPQGDNGFGYDPIFLPAEEFPNGRSSAELSAAEKNSLSHRRKALDQLVPLLMKG